MPLESPVPQFDLNFAGFPEVPLTDEFWHGLCYAKCLMNREIFVKYPQSGTPSRGLFG